MDTVSLNIHSHVTWVLFFPDFHLQQLDFSEVRYSKAAE